MTFGRRFNAIFDVTGNAEEQMRSITSGAARMSAQTARSATTVRTMGRELLNLSSASARSTQVSKNRAAETLKAQAIDRASDKVWTANTVAIRGLNVVQQERIRLSKSNSAEARTQAQTLRAYEAQIQKTVNATGTLSTSGRITSGRLSVLSNNFRQLARANKSLLSEFQNTATSLGGTSSAFRETERTVASMTSASDTGMKGLSKSEHAATLESNRLARAFEKASTSGNLTTASLRGFERRALSIAQTAAPALAKQLRNNSLVLRQLGNDTMLADVQTRNINRRFSFMEDVSAGTAKGMRTVSAASQGLMLSMSALDKNLQGVLFSLIFLQFSGALKTSLAFAGLAVATGLAFKAVTGFLKTRKEIKELGLALQVVTGSTKAFQLVQDRAKDIVGRFGLSSGQSKDLVKGLSTIMVELRRRGIEPTEDALKVFSAVFLDQKSIGKDFETAMQEASNSTIDFTKDMDKSSISIEDYEVSFKTLMERGANAMKILNENVGVDLNSIVDAFTKAGNTMDPIWQTAIDNAEGEWERVPPFVQTALAGALGFAVDELEGFDEPLSETVNQFETAFEKDIPKIIGYTLAKFADLESAIDEINETSLNIPGLGPISDESGAGFGGRGALNPAGSSLDIGGMSNIGRLSGPGGGGSTGDLVLQISGNSFNGSPTDNGRAIASEVGRIIGRGTVSGFSARVN